MMIYHNLVEYVQLNLEYVGRTRQIHWCGLVCFSFLSQLPCFEWIMSTSNMSLRHLIPRVVCLLLVNYLLVVSLEKQN